MTVAEGHAVADAIRQAVAATGVRAVVSVGGWGCLAAGDLMDSVERGSGSGSSGGSGDVFLVADVPHDWLFPRWVDGVWGSVGQQRGRPDCVNGSYLEAWNGWKLMDTFISYVHLYLAPIITRCRKEDSGVQPIVEESNKQCLSVFIATMLFFLLLVMPALIQRMLLRLLLRSLQVQCGDPPWRCGHHCCGLAGGLSHLCGPQLRRSVLLGRGVRKGR